VSKLDVSIRAQILNLFKDIQADTGMSMLFITHDLHVARYLCTRIGVMYFGKLVELGPTEELFRNPRHPYTRALLATVEDTVVPDGGRMLAEEAFNPTEDDRIGCRFYNRCPMRQDHCTERHPPLESVGPGHQVACFEWRREREPRKVQQRTEART
jgi:oligopeptide/dipeptide ABC transporter ATP-binding protein